MCRRCMRSILRLSGSQLELCRSQKFFDRSNCSSCYPNSTILFFKTAFALLYPLLPCFFFHSPLFSFQGADPRSKTGSKRSKSFKRFDPFSGGDKRDRTADLLRAKQALSHLSYTPIGNWWALVGSNHRPYDYQSYALAS